MNEIDIAEFRRERLRHFIEKHHGGNVTACSKALGYADGAALRQFLTSVRPITEKSIRKWGLEDWFGLLTPDDLPAFEEKTPPPVKKVAEFVLPELRMPEPLKKAIEAAAETSGRSLNAEIVARLQQSFDSSANDRKLLALTNELLELKFEYSLFGGRVNSFLEDLPEDFANDNEHLIAPLEYDADIAIDAGFDAIDRLEKLKASLLEKKK